MTVPTAHPWPSNGLLIQDVFSELLPAAGLWIPGESVLDVTYHDGLWWKDFTPDHLVYHSRRDDPTFDYRLLPWDTDEFDAGVFDPPYSGKGGRDTSGVQEMDDRYGLTDSPKRPADLLGMNLGGLMEICRVSRRVVLVKSMDFVTGGEMHWHTRHIETAAEMIGWTVYDRLIHLPTGGRPQPGGRAELHSRPRPSVLSILTPYKYRKGIKSRVSSPSVKLSL